MFPGLTFEGEEYETVGGLVFGVLGRVPNVGDRIAALGLDFFVERADRRRALSLRVERAESAVEERDNGDDAENAD